jgi:hypothetical protein
MEALKQHAERYGYILSLKLLAFPGHFELKFVECNNYNQTKN